MIISIMIIKNNKDDNDDNNDNNNGRTQEEADIASMNWKINIEEIQMPDR